jgi:hypothetical protein
VAQSKPCVKPKPSVRKKQSRQPGKFDLNAIAKKYQTSLIQQETGPVNQGGSFYGIAINENIIDAIKG